MLRIGEGSTFKFSFAGKAHVQNQDISSLQQQVRVSNADWLYLTDGLSTS